MYARVSAVTGGGGNVWALGHFVEITIALGCYLSRCDNDTPIATDTSTSQCIAGVHIESPRSPGLTPPKPPGAPFRSDASQGLRLALVRATASA